MMGQLKMDRIVTLFYKHFFLSKSKKKENLESKKKKLLLFRRENSIFKQIVKYKQLEFDFPVQHRRRTILYQVWGKWGKVAVNY